MQCFDFLDLSSFRFIYFPHRLVYYAFSYNLVTADSKKIRVCRRINARSRGKRILEATLRSVIRQGKKATHKCSRVEGGLPGPLKLQGPVSEPNSASCNRQLNSGSLHKQTRRNSLSRDVRSPVEDHDMVPSLSHNIKSETFQGV